MQNLRMRFSFQYTAITCDADLDSTRLRVKQGLRTFEISIHEIAHIYFHLMPPGDFNELIHLIEHGKVKSYQVKFFAGYSGWGEQQLEGEMKHGHWLLNEPYDASFFTTDPEELWGSELSEVKTSYGIFANFSCDPSLN